MKEIEDIVKAYSAAQNAGRKSALATVVHVEGSSYRRPGARMLVTDEGWLTGAISGGCLEGDALRKALLAISENKNKLVTYDTTDEDDAKFGVQLGCNGIVHILFEPINPSDNNNPVELLIKILQQRRDAALVTFFSLEEKRIAQPGTSMLFAGAETFAGGGMIAFAELPGSLINDVSYARSSKIPLIKDYKSTFRFTAFIDIIQSPVSLIIFGAGNDAVPLMDAAYILGWHTTVIDGRSSHATSQRFPKAIGTIVSKPSDALEHVTLDARTVFVLMTHNYNYDLAILGQLLQRACTYIGVLGPRQKLRRMLEELATAGLTIEEAALSSLYGPVGLDIGAETAEEIAISIIAEIKAVLENKKGDSLRYKMSGIHSRKTT